MRPAFRALWNLDLAFADVVSTTSDPGLGAIRLAWWRERLESLDQNVPAPAEPRLQAVASELLQRAVTGEELSRLEDAWLPALEPFPWDVPQVDGFRLRGRLLFGVGARLLGADPAQAELPGELWSLIDGAQHCSDERSRYYLLSAARSLSLRSPVPRRLRPLTIAAAVAVASAMGSGSGLARGLAAAKHRFRGRIPRLPSTRAPRR